MSDTELTPALLRAARALLGISQSELARLAGVSMSTVADFERGARMPIGVTLAALRHVCEEREILFLPDGVRLPIDRPTDRRIADVSGAVAVLRAHQAETPRATIGPPAEEQGPGEPGPTQA